MSGPSYLFERNQGITVTMVTFYYTFRHEQRPELFIRITDVEVNQSYLTSREERTHHLRTIMEKRLDDLKIDIIHEDISMFTLLLKGFPTNSEWLSFWNRRK
jgi:hypothetical protein